MFKIIKTSTYKEFIHKIEWLRQETTLNNAVVKAQNKVIDNLELQLHNLTAKKLPIKKSKNK